LYLKFVWEEAVNRNYNFDASKFDSKAEHCNIRVSTGQISFEKEHLLNKLKIRDRTKYELLHQQKEIELHPLFTIYPGEIELWERI
jgi:hypothetical protein